MAAAIPEGARVSHGVSEREYYDIGARAKLPWPPGPWDDEPDRIEWREGGLVCLAKRGPSGAWCGYVGVESGHPWHGLASGAAYELDVEIHGGVTYGDACAPVDRDGEQVGICHVPQPGEADHLWWIGFDCAHSWDVQPGREPSYAGHDSSYRDVRYVVAEVRSLAEQARAAGGVPS